MKPNLAIDLDGVFADFGLFMRELYHTEQYPQGEEEKFWKKAEDVDHLFYNLKKIHASDHLFRYVKKYESTHNVFILTSLPRLTGKLTTSIEDKHRWVKEHLGDIKVVCVHGWKKKKEYCRGPNDILIDDMTRNIDDWVNAGGTGIHHTDAFTTVNYLEYVLRDYG